MFVCCRGAGCDHRFLPSLPHLLGTALSFSSEEGDGGACEPVVSEVITEAVAQVRSLGKKQVFETLTKKEESD